MISDVGTTPATGLALVVPKPKSTVSGNKVDKSSRPPVKKYPEESAVAWKISEIAPFGRTVPAAKLALPLSKLKVPILSTPEKTFKVPVRKLSAPPVVPVPVPKNVAERAGLSEVTPSTEKALNEPNSLKLNVLNEVKVFLA